MRTVRELFETQGGRGEPRPITMDDFREILRRRKPSIKPEMIKLYEQWYRDFQAV